MMPSIKNSIIFICIAATLVLLYIFFIKKDPQLDNLVSTSPGQINTIANLPPATADKDFLPLLLNVKNIKLDDSIFTNSAFASLIDGSITLTPEGNEGRPNPFAPLGVEGVTSSSNKSVKTNPSN